MKFIVGHALQRVRRVPHPPEPPQAQAGQREEGQGVMKRTEWVVRDKRSGASLATFDIEAEADVYLRLARWGGSFWPTLLRYAGVLIALAGVLIYRIVT